MSGSRCRALRKLYTLRVGEPPSRTQWTDKGYRESTWRILKKDYRRYRAYGLLSNRRLHGV